MNFIFTIITQIFNNTIHSFIKYMTYNRVIKALETIAY